MRVCTFIAHKDKTRQDSCFCWGSPKFKTRLEKNPDIIDKVTGNKNTDTNSQTMNIVTSKH